MNTYQTTKFFRLSISSKTLLTISIAFTYSYTLANLPFLEFQDRSNYLNYYENGVSIYEDFAARSILALVFNEPIWLVINILLKRFIPDPVSGVRLIIFAGSFLSSYFFVNSISQKRSSIITIIVLSLLFILNPFFLKNYIIHLRQGFAIGIFMMGMSFRGWTKIVLIGMTPFIHSSFFFVALILQLNKVLERFLSLLREIKINRGIVLATILVSVLIVSLYFDLSSMLRAAVVSVGDRRASEYKFKSAVESGASGLGWLFWLFVLILMTSSSKRYLTTYSFSFYSITLYLITYFFVDFTARIFESSLPIVILDLLDLKGWRKNLFLSIMLAFFAITWYRRLPLRSAGF